MAIYLKHGRNPDTAAADDKQVRTVVETLLADVQDRGDAAVRELSIRFDGLDRADFRLTDQEIRDCLAEFRPARSRTSSSPRRRCAILPSTSASRCATSSG